MRRKIISIITIISVFVMSQNIAYAGSGEVNNGIYNMGAHETFDATSEAANLKVGDVILYEPENSSESLGMSAQVVLPPGKYQIECWGSKGGKSISIANIFGEGNIQQGNGGYSSAVYDVDDEQRIYLYAGGDGITAEFGEVILALTSVLSVISIFIIGAAGLLTICIPMIASYMVTPSVNSGYNGGGHGDICKGLLAGYYTGGGGGATHVALTPGLLRAHKNDYKDKLLLAAGGGSGSTTIITTFDTIQDVLGKNAEAKMNKDGFLGCGGGECGYPAKSDLNALGYEYTLADLKKWGYYSGLSGTQSSGGESIAGNRGSFGQGADGYASYDTASPGAGGGFYGGGTCPEGEIGTSGGGSGYINSSLVSDGSLIAGNKEMPSPSGGTELGHSNRGAIKITVLSLDDKCQNVLYSPNIVPLGEKFRVRSENTYNMNMLKIKRISYALKSNDGFNLSESEANFDNSTRQSVVETDYYSAKLIVPANTEVRQGSVVMTVEYTNGRVETMSRPVEISVVETDKVVGPRYIGRGSLPAETSRWATDNNLKKQLSDSLERSEPIDSVKLK